jgi:hypothetical protein
VPPVYVALYVDRLHQIWVSIGQNDRQFFKHGHPRVHLAQTNTAPLSRDSKEVLDRANLVGLASRTVCGVS